MKVWILHDTLFGNGKLLAETLAKEFSPADEVHIGHIKDTSPTSVSDDSPDVLIFGGAIRKFQGAPASKKWIKKLDKAMKNREENIKYAFAFLTHALPTKMVQGYSRRFLKKLTNADSIKNVYPEGLTARVLGQEGPFADGEIENAKSFFHDFQKWMS